MAEEAELVEEFRSLAGGGLPGHHGRGRAPAAQGPDGRRGVSEQLGKLEREFRAERRRDYFRSPLGAGGSERTKGRPRSREGQRRAGRSRSRRGRDLMLWATRRGCHVDRTACIWLIRRFMDSDASFAFFGDPAEAPEGAELFDVVGARLSHRGEDCSFETFLKEYELEDPVLGEIAEIVHDADLMDEKYARPESEGLDAIVRGMQLSLPDDQTLTAPHRRPLRRPLRLPQPGSALRLRTSENSVKLDFSHSGRIANGLG